MTNDVYIAGVLRQRWDFTTRTYTEYDETGELTLTRPFNASENANADEVALAAEESANAEEIGTKIETVDMPAMQAILDQTNANIRADPSQEIKDIAKAVRRLDRKVQRLLDGTD